MYTPIYVDLYYGDPKQVPHVRPPQKKHNKGNPLDRASREIKGVEALAHLDAQKLLRHVFLETDL